MASQPAEPANRREKLRWGLTGVGILLAVEMVVGVVWLVSNIQLGTDAVVDCSFVAEYLDQPAMPQHMTDAQCRYMSWTDINISADFTLHSVAPLEEWLQGLPESPTLEADFCLDEYNLCADAHFDPPLPSGGYRFSVDVAEIEEGVRVSINTGTT